MFLRIPRISWTTTLHVFPLIADTNTWEPVHFLSAKTGTDAITLEIHLHPSETNPLSLPGIFAPAVPRGVLVFRRARSRDGSGCARDECLHISSVPLLQERGLAADLRHLVSRYSTALQPPALRRRTRSPKSRHNLSLLSFLRYFKLRFQRSMGVLDASYP